MELYQLRVIDERNALYKKIIQLRYWLSANTADDSEWETLQLRTMEMYLKILDQRIEGWLQ